MRQDIKKQNLWITNDAGLPIKIGNNWMLGGKAIYEGADFELTLRWDWYMKGYGLLMEKGVHKV